MKRWSICTATFAAAAMVMSPADAAEDCQCDCYFSFDCAGGQFCDYGSSFTIEDECWWRQPKPEGAPGSGCEGHYGDWGQCDGKCSGTAEAAAAVGDEKVGMVLSGIHAWWQAFNAASMEGGGTPGIDTAMQVESMEFANPSMSSGLWRMTLDVMVLARGSDYVIFPEQNEFYYTDVAVANLAHAAPSMRNGNIAMGVLISEVNEPLSGRVLMDEIDIATLDQELFARICPSGDVRECLYERLTDMAAVLRHAKGATPKIATIPYGAVAGGVQPECAGCPGDCASDDVIDVADVLALLADWGASGGCSDVNGDNSTDTGDLLEMLSAWGACAL